GASNLQHYIYYKEKPHEKRLYFDYQLKYNDTPYREEPEEMYKTTELEVDTPSNSYTINLWQKYHMEQTEPSVTNKLRVRYGNEWKAGVMYNHNKGETNLFDSDFETFNRNGKYFLGYQKRFNGNNSLKIFAGNYRVTYGEGLVMENTDFYSSRKTGFGFSKTIKGIIGDLSRTREYALRGAAAEWRSPKLNASMFISSDYKDAVVYDSNGDGLFTDDDNMLAYITQTRSFDSDIFENTNYTMAPEENAFKEDIIGGHLEYSPILGSSVGITAYEATYDRDFVVYGPDSLRYLLMPDPDDAEGKYKMMDSEIAALYSTKTDSYDRNYRRVYGFDWRTVINNTSFQGEYAELEVDGNMFKLGDDPKALVISSYTQFDNLYLLSLYRNYDLGFDNPYSRGFSEHQKFDDTALDKYAHTLANPLLRDMYINSAQAQAEEGVYFETRYRFHRMLTLNRTYVDIWERKADGRKSVRFQGELDFRPVYQLSLRLKYKHQINRYDDDADRGVSKTNETTGKIRAYLSNYDLLELEYRYLNVWQPPYTYLTNDPEPGGNTIAQGSMLSHADYICADYTHYFNDNLKVKGSFIYWDGNGVSHWDWEDIEIDFMGEGGTKFWFALHDKISNNLYLTLKFKTKRYKTKEVEWRAWWNDLPESGEYYYETVRKTENAIRLQLDWKF
ncbi:MAG: competence protein ComEA, partial [Candidatus Cloacimonadota bacterium]|nr:competence protein ComEA [Candidatus Cloacimonadota bacterium]